MSKIKNKNNITELVFILDRSGSMSGLEKDTIGGFNSLIEKQKKQEGKCFVSTVLFDNYSEVLHDRVELANINLMTDKDYTVRGCTALFDAGNSFFLVQILTQLKLPGILEYQRTGLLHIVQTEAEQEPILKLFPIRSAL